jgi:radical SAM protein with 4Fe4S-binding SPASM domain
VRARNAKGRALPIIFAILPVTELNFRSIQPAVEALSHLPVEAINIGLRWFVPKDVGAQYESVMRDAFGIQANSWKGFEFAWPGGKAATSSPDMVGLVKLLKGLRRRRLWSFVNPRRAWLSFVPDIPPASVPSYLTDHAPTFGHDMCPAPWFFAQVLPDGEVVVCGDFPDYSLGNVRKTPFADVWLGPKAQAFRAKLAKEPLPICNRCCGLFVHGRWERPRAQRLI